MISFSTLALILPLTAVGALLARARPAGKADADMQGVLDKLDTLGPKPIELLSPAEARRQPTPADAVKAYLKAKGKSAEPEPVREVADRVIAGQATDIALRIYWPEVEGAPPIIVYYHGGGFVLADLDGYDATPRALANAAEAIVVSCHYRQAPEHKFPAAHEDAMAAYEWVVEYAEEIGGDGSRIAVAGESAGGNLAAAVCLMAREAGAPEPLHQLLVYPVADTNMDTPSYRDQAHAKPLSRAMMAWFFKHAATPQDSADPRLGLLKSADLRGLPPVTLITAELDPLRSEGEALAAKFKTAGVPVHYRNYDGVTHEFFGMAAAVGKAEDAVKFAATQLRKAFH